MSRYKKAAIVGLILLPVIVGGFAVQERAVQSGTRLFEQVVAIVGERYVDSLETGALYEKAARGLVTELKDPYAELYSAKQLESFNTTTGGFYGGVGMQIEPQDGAIVISKVFPNTPAAEAGIMEGDRIVAVDSQSTRGWKLEQVSGKLKGPPGTKVSARFARQGAAQQFTVQFTRRVVRIPAVAYSMMFDNKAGYILVQGFNETAAEEVAAALQRLNAAGAKGLVLDLRGNPGGFLDQALTMTNLFLDKGKEILAVRGRGQPEQKAFAESTPIAPKIPLVILTDGYTASASEIVAGALQDHDRALIVGTTSFGKGLVQSLYKLDGGYAIKLTTAKWYTPSGRSIQKERKLTDDGQLVEVHPDSLETAAMRALRPQFKSDGGRVVYGGGAITPDITIPYDTLTTAEQKLAGAMRVKQQETYVTLYEYGFEMKDKVKPDFEVTPAMKDEFFARLQKKGVNIDRKDWDAGLTYVDRLLDNRIARFAFGDSAAKRRDLHDDPQLRKALELLKKGQSQKDLLAMAATVPVKPSK